MQNLLNHAGLWPTIHTAVDCFVRRQAAGANRYELIWRLIHISECTIITLASTASTQIRDELADEESEILLDLRAETYGKTWDDSDRAIKSTGTKGALKGSIDSWIEVLNKVKETDESASDYVQSLREWLSSDAYEVDTGDFLSKWEMACDVPETFKQTPKTSTWGCLKRLNTFRNRLAHVPFPHDPMDAVYGEFYDVISTMFEDANQVSGNGLDNPLSGGFVAGNRVWTGDKRFTQEVDDEVEPAFCWGEPGSIDIWKGSPFLHFDDMMRPHLLTRLRNEVDGIWEYTRFKAERDAVKTVTDKARLEEWKEPAEQEYLSALGLEEETEPDSDDSLYAEALDDLSADRFSEAASKFQEVVEERTAYHVGWLKLGIARREAAVRDELAGTELEGLQASKEALEEATEHSRDSYRARAFYQLSKTWNRIADSQTGEDKEEALDKAFDYAGRAVDLGSSDRFESWLEHLIENRL